MHNLSQKLTRPLVLLAALACSPAGFATPAQAATSVGSAQYGSVAAEQAAGKTIVITAKTKSVNVDNGDTVRFINGDTTFIFHFDTVKGKRVFALSAIAPPGFVVDTIKVYVSSTPIYRE